MRLTSTRFHLTGAGGHGPMLCVGRALRSFATVAAGLALLAMVPTCPCPERTAPASHGHACCAPPTGVSATDHGCCDGHDRAHSDLLIPGPLPAAAPAAVAVVRAEPIVRLEAAPHGSVLSSPSPPPSILRI